MSDVPTENSPNDVQNNSGSDVEEFALQWGNNAPRGAKVVLGRIIKDGANVPLFLGQSLINSLRDTGYNNTTSAICEHVDNAIESGATTIRIYFSESGPKNRRLIHVLILDNGSGMSPNILKAACAFGGSMRFDNRGGIGRFGMGMKAAALSMSPVLDVFSWQEPNAYYNMTLDVQAIGQEKSNVIMLPNPELLDTLPAEVAFILNNPMIYPKNPNESQELMCHDTTELKSRLGRSGTIIFMPNCDRLTYRKIQTLVDNATREMSRIYRRQLDKGIKLYINNRLVEPFDPMYQMKTARHARISELSDLEKNSRLVNRWDLPIPISEGAEITSVASVRMYFLPIRAWSELPRKVLKNDLKVFDIGGISFMRSDREVDIKSMEGIGGKRNTRDSWWRLEVDFHGDLDEAFGVAMTKQGVRPKSYVQELIRGTIIEDLHGVRRAIEQYWSEQATLQNQSGITSAEQKANETETFQATLLPQPPSPKTEEEERILNENLKSLAIGLKRAEETDEQAFQRVKSSRFITTYKHDEDSPFYRVDFKLGKVILTLNTAHLFYEKLYKPLSTIAKKTSETGRFSESDDEQIDIAATEECSQVLITLQLLLLSLGRTQSEMIAMDQSNDLQRIFDKLRRQWSSNLETQLMIV